MAQPTYGTHRVKNPGLEDGVWITDGKNGFEIPESRYRENGYKPRVEELPWRSSVKFTSMIYCGIDHSHFRALPRWQLPGQPNPASH
jgi:hypothetical protein